MAVTAIHPGEHLAEELQVLDMSAAELALQLDVPTNRITQILNGTRAITGDTAIRLAHFFGTSAEFWQSSESLRPAARTRKGGKINQRPSETQATRTNPGVTRHTENVPSVPRG